MCGRYVSGDMTWQQYHDWLTGKAAPPPPKEPQKRRWNIPPTEMAPIVRKADGELALSMARWGFIPGWWKKPLSELRLSTFNARSEEAADKPFFRDAMKNAHCLTPAMGYYEWSGPKGKKQPYFIHAQTNEPGICFAGLWSRVQIADFEGLTFTILTQAATGELETLHHRMPIILSPNAYGDWLDGAPIGDVEQLPPDRLKWHPVSKAVGNVKNEVPDLIEEVAT